MSKEQTALERIKDEVAKEMMFDNAKQAALDRASIDEIAKRFARECCQATLEDLKSKIREAMKPEIVNSQRIHREPDFLFACDEILKLIDSIK